MFRGIEHECCKGLSARYMTIGVNGVSFWLFLGTEKYESLVSLFFMIPGCHRENLTNFRGNFSDFQRMFDVFR